jgi:glycosyltransferase involved in cell wall biosynthesis
MLGVSLPDVSDWRQPQPRGKWSQFFGAVAGRFTLVDVVQPGLTRTETYLNQARAFHPRMRRWRARAGFNRSLAMKRTRAVQRGLQRHDYSCDLIMQLQTLCAPGFDRRGIPYAIYTDSTMALLQRLYPAYAPLSPEGAARWMSFEADVCRSAEAVFTFSKFARSSIIEDYGCSPDRVVAVGAGVNQMLGSLGERDFGTARALFVGVDFTRKGGRVLLDAWPLVHEQIPQAELVIAGPKRQPRNELPPGVRWTGPVDREGLRQLYQSASVFVLPSLFEPWGHVFLEAMGHGLPCIGTSCCAMPEIIEDGVSGRLVPRFEPEPLAAAMIELLSDAAGAAAMGQAGYARVSRGSSWRDVADRVAGHLDGLGPVRRVH